MAMTWARTVVSAVSRTIFQTFVTRLPQKPACSHSPRSSTTSMFVPL